MVYPKTTHVLKKIKRMRESKGYSQEYMAFKLQIQQSTYHKLESGKTRLKLVHFLKILETLEIDIQKVMETKRPS